MGKRFISRKWRMRKAVWYLYGAEFAFTIPTLALFAIAQPNTYRDKLRAYGAQFGWNSSKDAELYALYNHQIAVTPPPWNEFTTDFNVVISVLSMFFMLVKAAAFMMHIFWPIFGVITHAALVGLYAYSVYAQTAPDYLDPTKPSPSPWYIRYGCANLPTHSLSDYCRQAQASLACAVIMMALFALNTLLAIYSCVPTKAQKEKWARQQEEDDLDYEENNFKFPPPPQSKEARMWETEMHRFDKETESRSGSPGPSQLNPSQLNPMTPRTTAFHRLGGTSHDLPLRQQQ